MARPPPQQQHRPAPPLPRHSQSRQQQQPQLPFSLLCCPNALPQTLTHLVHLLPSTTTHTPFSRPLSLGPLLTPFLILLATSPPTTQQPRLPTFNPYTLLIQVIRSKPLSYTHHPNSQTQIVSNEEYSEPRYFGLLTPESETERQNMKVGGAERVKGQVYLEVEKAKAERCLRFPGSGGESIGDGEVWTRVKGWEKIWCEDCSVWWEFRVWVREL